MLVKRTEPNLRGPPHKLSKKAAQEHEAQARYANQLGQEVPLRKNKLQHYFSDYQIIQLLTS